MIYKHVLLKRQVFTGERAAPQEHDERLSSSKSRTRRIFFELAMCNNLPLFVTGTFDAKKVEDRGDYGVFKKLSQWFSDFKKRKDSAFQYLLAIENHEDGAFHYHGFMSRMVGLCSPLRIPKKIDGKVQLVPNTPGYMHWPAIHNKFGFFSCTEIKDYEKAVGYCCKYVTKSMCDIAFKNKRIILHSNDLKQPELVHTGYEYVQMGKPDFENEFCAVLWKSLEETTSTYTPWYHLSDFDFEKIRTMTIFEATAVYGEQMGLF